MVYLNAAVAIIHREDRELICFIERKLPHVFSIVERLPPEVSGGPGNLQMKR